MHGQRLPEGLQELVSTEVLVVARQPGELHPAASAAAAGQVELWVLAGDTRAALVAGQHEPRLIQLLS